MRKRVLLAFLSATLCFGVAACNEIGEYDKSVCGDGVIDEGELCDGAALGGKTCESELGQGSSGTLACANDCQSLNISGCVAPASCGNGELDAGELCDFLQSGEAVFAQGARVCPDSLVVDDIEKILCTTNCQIDSSACVTAGSCGDGEISEGEICDGEALDSQICATVYGEGSTGVLACADDCTNFNTDLCVKCGDERIGEGEVCDGELLQDKTCADVYGEGSTGVLACADDCTNFNTDLCVKCGDERIGEGEVCDGELLEAKTCADIYGEGSTGVLACADDCSGYDTSLCVKCGDGRIGEGEVCDGEELDGKTCETQLGTGASGSLSCANDCKSLVLSECLPAPGCGNKHLDEGELCDLLENGDSVFAEGKRVCPEGYEIADSNGIVCTAQCAIDTSACSEIVYCGDGKVTGQELCDGSNFAGKTCDNSYLTGATGKLLCEDSCSQISTADCILCGDGRLNGSEVCDGTNFGDKTCASELGAGATGALTCSADCKNIITTSCAKCGDGKIDVGEVCDGTNLNAKTCATEIGQGATGTLACAADCKSFDTSACERCGDGTKKCSEGQLLTCADGLWNAQSDATCELGYECVEGATSCSKKANYCEHGKCEDNKEYKCNNRELDEGTECSSGYECQSGYYACRQKANYCDKDKCEGINLHIQYCVDNELQAPVPCDPGYECPIGIYSPNACVKAINYCDTSRCNPENDKWRECVNHLLGNWQDCNNTSCKDTISCGECKNGNKICDGSVYKECSSGMWSEAIDCAAQGKICDITQGCVEQTVCGDGTKSADEVCDASDTSHELSGEGIDCNTYASNKYNANGGKVKCSDSCTIDDNACDIKTYVHVGLCRFLEVDQNTLSLRFTPETGTSAGEYQFRLSCAKTMSSNADHMTDIRMTFEKFTVPANNNSVYEITYDLEAFRSNNGDGNFETFSSKGPGLHHCVLQVRRAASLKTSWGSADSYQCSAQAGKKAQSSANIDDTLPLDLPDRVELARWNFETDYTPSSGTLTTDASLSRVPAGDLELAPAQGVDASQAAAASTWSLLSDKAAVISSSVPYLSLKFSTAGKSGIALSFKHKGNYTINTTPEVHNKMILALERDGEWVELKEFANYNANYPTSASSYAFNGDISKQENVELRFIPYDMKVDDAKIFLDDIVIKAWE
ncbi:MAG: hypothetical protein ACOX8U_01015 [Bradymonadia bacterium]